jgi:hypothetical protein
MSDSSNAGRSMTKKNSTSPEGRPWFQDGKKKENIKNKVEKRQRQTGKLTTRSAARASYMFLRLNVRLALAELHLTRSKAIDPPGRACKQTVTRVVESYFFSRGCKQSRQRIVGVAGRTTTRKRPRSGTCGRALLKPKPATLRTSTYL